MEETRTIHELLIILRDNAKVSKSWFVDSTGKFNPGDTIAFQLYK